MVTRSMMVGDEKPTTKQAKNQMKISLDPSGSIMGTKTKAELFFRITNAKF
jgi:hypothetical protein